MTYIQFLRNCGLLTMGVSTIGSLFVVGIMVLVVYIICG